MSKKIIFKQEAVEGVTAAYTKEFDSFEEIREWVIKDKMEEHGDVLAAYLGGKFDGLTSDQWDEIRELEQMTYEDAMLENATMQDLKIGSKKSE